MGYNGEGSLVALFSPAVLWMPVCDSDAEKFTWIGAQLPC
ncbi:MAG: hypothetical protein ACI9W6_002088 [Motiliproteus sp.]